MLKGVNLCCAPCLQEDPLQETLDGMLPLEVGSSGEGEGPVRVPQGVEEVCRELKSEDGITGIWLGRQVIERRTVSQVRSALCVQHFEV